MDNKRKQMEMELRLIFKVFTFDLNYTELNKNIDKFLDIWTDTNEKKEVNNG